MNPAAPKSKPEDKGLEATLVHCDMRLFVQPRKKASHELLRITLQTNIHTMHGISKREPFEGPRARSFHRKHGAAEIATVRVRTPTAAAHKTICHQYYFAIIPQHQAQPIAALKSKTRFRRRRMSQHHQRLASTVDTESLPLLIRCGVPRLSRSLKFLQASVQLEGRGGGGDVLHNPTH